MAKRSELLLLWTARVLSILVCVFLSLFALDAFSPANSVVENIRAFVLHVWPMVALGAVVALSWRREWVGGFAFSGLGVAYAYWARHHVAWVVTVSGPLLVVGVLFLLSWVRHRRIHGAA